MIQPLYSYKSSKDGYNWTKHPTIDDCQDKINEIISVLNGPNNILIEKGKKVAAIEILQLIEQVCFSEEFINFRVDHGSHGERDYIITQIKERYGIE